MRFRLLGPLEIEGAERLGGPQQRLVLALLLCQPNEVVSTDRFIDEIWGESPPPAARNSLQSYVSNLRRVLGGEAIVSEAGGYVLRTEANEVDSQLFEELVEEGARMLAAGDAEAAGNTLREALTLWRGPPFVDLAYVPALQMEKGRLEERRLKATEDRIEADLAMGRHQELVSELETMVGGHSLRERLWGLLMLALYRSGRQAEALDAYQRARRHLAEELGIDPSPQLQRLEEQILLQDASLAWSVGGRDAIPNNLPAETTSFVGRDRELADIEKLLDEARLVTLTGVGGCGKTRLALQVAGEVSDEFPDGVWFVALSQTRDPTLVPQAVAAALGIPVSGGADATGLLSEALRGKTSLLLLDTYEHVIEAGPFVTQLLAAASDLKVLVTSRERLRVSGEHVYEVSPLTVPSEDEPVDAKSLGHSEAATLFVERARAERSDFEASDETAADIAAICRALDGLPLAVELAAARSRVLSPSALRERLTSRLATLTTVKRDLPARQQTLRATIDWSHDLLDEEEQRLFACLAVFVGGSTLGAIDSVYGPDPDLNTLEGLESLVDKSLLRIQQLADGKDRFEMLDTIGEYAKDQLASATDAHDIQRRHCQYFAHLAERAEPELHGRESERWYDVLYTEFGNLRAALAWAFGGGDPVLGCRLIGSAHWFWFLDQFGDLATWTSEALTHEHLLDASVRARVYLSSGLAEFGRGNLIEARQRWTKARSWFQELGDRRYETRATTLLAMSYIGVEEDYERAAGMATAALAAAREINNEETTSLALIALGELARLHGDVDAAESAYQQSLSLAREMGDRRYEAQALLNLTSVAQLRGDFEAAERLASEGLRLALARNDRLMAAYCVAALAGPALQAGRYDKAARLLGASDQTLESLGTARQPAEEPQYERILAALSEKLGPDELKLLMAEGGGTSLEEAAAYAVREEAN